MAEAVAHLRELERETGSHLTASRQDYRYAASLPEIVSIVHAEMFANLNRDSKKQKEPIRFPTPLPEPEESTAATAEEVEQARAVLKKYSMFAD